MLKTMRSVSFAALLSAAPVGAGPLAWAQDSETSPATAVTKPPEQAEPATAAPVQITPGQIRPANPVQIREGIETREALQRGPVMTPGTRLPVLRDLKTPDDSEELDAVIPDRAFADQRSIDDLPAENAADGPLIDAEIAAFEVPLERRRFLPSDTRRSPAGEIDGEILDENDKPGEPLNEVELHAYEFAELDAPTDKLLEPRTDLDAFFADLHVHGYSFATARELGRANFDEAAEKLMNPDYAQIHSGLATAIGLSGAPQAEEVLWRFIASGRGALSPRDFNARADAIMSLGYLAEATDGEAGMERLLKAAAPEFWLRDQAVGWTRDGVKEDTAAQAAWLARTALKGLALSGQPKGEAALAALIGADRSAFGADLPYDDELVEWIGISKEIAEMGVIAYTDRPHDHDK